MEHEHYVDEQSEFKFNGGNPVFLCGYEDCRVIVAYAVKIGPGMWEVGERYLQDGNYDY